MKIIVTAAPLIGHLNPVLVAGRLLAGRGHEVIGYAPGVFRKTIEANGLLYHPVPPEADVDISDVDRFFPERRGLRPGFAARRQSWMRFFVERADSEYRGLRDLLQAFPADAVIAESMTFATLPLLMGPPQARPRIVHVGATFLQLSREDRAPMFTGLPPARTEEERAGYARLFAEAKEEWFDPVDRFLDGMLAGHGCPPLPMPFYDAQIRLPDRFLQTGVPGLELPRPEVPSSLSYIGASPPPAGLFPIPDWAADLEDGRKVVLVTQGTVANADLSQLIRPTLDALADEPDLIVVTACGKSVESLGRLPDNVRAAPFLPYDWLMPRLDLLVTNGGYGTVTHALSLGVPLVQAGTTEDKREVATRITLSGTGIALGTDRPDAPAIRGAVRQVLDTPSYRLRARALAGEFETHGLARQIGPIMEGLVRSPVGGRQRGISA
jgi:UDP:flavonoid glycosyltransferase YjiC (YdhE family)